MCLYHCFLAPRVYLCNTSLKGVVENLSLYFQLIQKMFFVLMKTLVWAIPAVIKMKPIYYNNILVFNKWLVGNLWVQKPLTHPEPLFAQIKDQLDEIRRYLVSISRVNETICFVELDVIDLWVSMKVKWSKRTTSFIWLINKHVIDISHFFLYTISVIPSSIQVYNCDLELFNGI